jgi:hypothetical protein
MISSTMVRAFSSRSCAVEKHIDCEVEIFAAGNVPRLEDNQMFGTINQSLIGSWQGRTSSFGMRSLVQSEECRC